MIYTVTLNPSLDYIMTVEDFRKNQINRSLSEYILPGGKGINVSAVLNNLGIENIALGFTAGFTGNRIKKLLDEYGVKHCFTDINSGFSRINVKICDNLNTVNETQINGTGPHISHSDLERLFNSLDCLLPDDILVLSGNVPKSLPDTIYMSIMEKLTEHKTKIIVDAQNSALLNTLKFKPFLIKPNTYELGELFNDTVNNFYTAQKYAVKLKEMGAVNVLVSMGSNGALLLAENDKVYKAKAPSGSVINTIGAGDSMIAGFIYGYLNTYSFKEALKYGICAGSASAFSKTLATKQQIIDLYTQYEIISE